MNIRLQVKPALDPLSGASFNLDGEVGRRLAAVTEQWILPLPKANPRILEMFRDRDCKPYKDQTPWAGEFAGKYLTHCTQIYRLTREQRLREHVDWFVGQLVALQDDDGYLGPWPRAWRLKPDAPNQKQPWDAWGHYHIMLGLILWHHDSGDERALKCVKRIGDYLCRRFLNNSDEKLHDTGRLEANLSPIHSLTLLYQITGEQRYLDLALQIEKEFEIIPAGDYVREALAGKEFFQTPAPRWESLHPIMGLSELYLATGDKRYRRAFEHLWWSMLKGDRHNNGGFTSHERATGNPYDRGAIETCCTIAWMAMSIEMLRLSGDSIVADELELSLFNSGLGLISPSGRWVTYNTPMDGRREASADTIVFQARAGSSELNCCSVNGPRALGLTCEWAIMRDANGLALNYYGPGVISAPLASGNEVKLTQKTDYPRDSRIELLVECSRTERFTLSLRIPHWSQRTTVEIDGGRLEDLPAGQYLRLERTWQAETRIRIDFDFNPHFWAHKPCPHFEDWQTDWQIFGPIPSGNESAPAHQSLQSAVTMPRSVVLDGKDLPPVLVRSTDGLIDFNHLEFSKYDRKEIYCFTEIECAVASIVPIIYAADEFSACLLNGQTIYDTRASGDPGDPWARRQEVELNLKAGKNLIGFRIASGRHAWHVSVGKAASIDPSAPVYATSIYRGPILLAYDPRFNESATDALPEIDSRRLNLRPVEARTWLKPWMLLETVASDGRSLRLCDFASAGAAGDFYFSWLPVRLLSAPNKEFSRANPLRSFRVPEDA